MRSSRFLNVALLCVVAAATGCSRLRTDYGRSKGSTGRTSLNGFSALRASFEQAGFRTRDVSRLSDRVSRTDVIIWTPQMLSTVDARVTRWFEGWLTRGNRTLVYVVPDSGSEADYWSDAAQLAPPAQRLEYRKRAARSVNERMMWRLNRRQMQSNGWFRVQPLMHRTPLGKIDGLWKDDLSAPDQEEQQVSVEFVVTSYDPDQKAPAPAGGFTASGPTGPGTPNWSAATETTASRTPVEHVTLVSTAAEDPVVAEITSENWPNSRIIVVAGGSLLTNYAFTRSLNRQLAQQIILASTPQQKPELRAGFLTSNWNQIPVSEQKPGVPRATGMELLTVWPISMVTMHGAMLGLVICLMLFPIFGRPKPVRHAKQSSFGHHLDAVAALMNRVGGEAYARSRISEYMKRMHGETSGPWVLADTAEPGERRTSSTLASKRRAHHELATRESDQQASAESEPAATGAAETGSAATGLANTGLAETGSAETGLAATEPADRGSGQIDPAGNSPLDASQAGTDITSTTESRAAELDKAAADRGTLPRSKTDEADH